jgi:hypothetical protein
MERRPGIKRGFWTTNWTTWAKTTAGEDQLARLKYSRFAGENCMARPGFEPGTPRFSGAPDAAEKPADLQDAPE